MTSGSYCLDYDYIASKTMEISRSLCNILFFKEIHGDVFVSFYNFYLCAYVLAVLGLRGCVSFSLVASSQDYSLVEMRGLIVVTSLVAEHKALRLE